MKVVYFGSDVFLSCFEYFLQEHEVLELYTYHNDEDYFSEYTIVKMAREQRIPVHYEAITSQEVVRLFTEEGCGLLFSAEYDRLVPVPEDLPAFRGINIHNSLLPQGRSYYPIEAAMERGLGCTGVTMHKLAPRLDQGDILMQHEVEISPETDSIDVYLWCAAYARKMTEKIMDDLEGYWHRALPQKEKVPYWKRPDPPLLTLEHTMPRAAALDMFKKYNSMTQVMFEEEWFYVTGMQTGTAPFDEEGRRLSPVMLLYPVSDGYLRLNVRIKEAKE